MKKSLYFIAVAIFLLTACKTPQKITSTWINKDVAPSSPYKSIMVIVMAKSVAAKFSIESQMAKLIRSRGQKVVESGDIFPPGLAGDSKDSKDILVRAIERTGCDAVFTMAILDVKTEKSYQPGSYFAPVSMYDYYGNYGAYYSYRLAEVYQPGYYTENKTYFIETNFYDLKKNALLWSIQSKACNPSDLEKWFKEYSGIMLTELKKQNLIKK